MPKGGNLVETAQGRRLSAKNEYTRLSIKEEMRKSILNDRPVSMNEKGNLEPKPDEGRLISCKHKWLEGSTVFLW